MMTYVHSDVIFTDPAYALKPPCNQDPVPLSLVQKIVTCLSTRFDLPAKTIRPHLQTASLKRYSKVQRLHGGDLMNASSLVTFGDDRRDATFVRVSRIFEHNSNG